jgi:hypothetical protein
MKHPEIRPVLIDLESGILVGSVQENEIKVNSLTVDPFKTDTDFTDAGEDFKSVNFE